MPAKPKQWILTQQDEKFITYRHEAPESAQSGLWIELRYSIGRAVYTSFRTNASEGEPVWIRFDKPRVNHAVAKREAFAAIAYSTVPLTADV